RNGVPPNLIVPQIVDERSEIPRPLRLPRHRSAGQHEETHHHDPHRSHHPTIAQATTRSPPRRPPAPTVMPQHPPPPRTRARLPPLDPTHPPLPPPASKIRYPRPARLNRSPRMRSILLLTPLLALPTLFACHGPRRLPEPQPPTSRPAGFLFREHEHDGRTYRYAGYVPRELPENPPVVLFLHGRGESGTDGSRQIAVGIGRELLWNPDRWPAIVLLPQKPDHESQWPEHEPAVLGILDAAIDEFGADPRRVVLTGLSQGGHGSWIIASRNPGRFARVAPVCGYVRFPFRGEDLPHAAPDQPEFRGLAGGL